MKHEFCRLRHDFCHASWVLKPLAGNMEQKAWIMIRKHEFSILSMLPAARSMSAVACGMNHGAQGMNHASWGMKHEFCSLRHDFCHLSWILKPLAENMEHKAWIMLGKHEFSILRHVSCGTQHDSWQESWSTRHRSCFIWHGTYIPQSEAWFLRDAALILKHLAGNIEHKVSIMLLKVWNMNVAFWGMIPAARSMSAVACGMHHDALGMKHAS